MKFFALILCLILLVFCSTITVSGKLPIANHPIDGRLLPSSGAVNIAVILIDFPDVPHGDLQTRTDINSKIFGSGDSGAFPYDSVKNYYLRSSNNKLNIYGDLYGWYTASHDRSYYAGIAKRDELIKEAILFYDVQGADFSKYDNDNDGYIEGIFFVYSGPSDSNTMFWPQQWTWGYQTPQQESFKVDGKIVFKYVWTCYSFSTNSLYDTRAGIHETGHLIGLGDLYENKGSLKGGDGGWDMMDQSQGDFNSFWKMFLDWYTPKYTITERGPQKIELGPVSSTGDFAIIAPLSDDSGEYYLIEYRKSGIGNDYPIYGKFNGNYGMFGGHDPGLVIWHIDTTLIPLDLPGTWNFKYNNQNTPHKLIRLMESDGLEHIENRDAVNWFFDENDFYTPGKEFTPFTHPNSNYYSLEKSGIYITNLKIEDNGKMSAVITIDKNLAPHAGFGSNTSSGQVPLAVHFEDWSTGQSPVNYLWDFGDGSTSQERNPTHVYTTLGQKEVSLTVSNTYGDPINYGSHKKTELNFINVLPKTLPALLITSITPATGANTGTVSITNLAGTGFLSGATVKLIKNGQPDIVATDVNVLSSTKIICTLDLTGKASGQWSVVVSNPDSETGTLTDGFTVNSDKTDGNKIVGRWMLDRQVGRSDDIITYNFHSDGSFTDTHLFVDGREQDYDWGTWEYLGNDQYVVHQTSNLFNAICNGAILRNNPGTANEDIWHKITASPFTPAVSFPTHLTSEIHFDRQTGGAFPAGWGKVFSGRGWEYAVIDNSQFNSTPNSVKLEGSGGWSQDIGRSILPPPDTSATYDYSGGIPESEYNTQMVWLQQHPDIWFECNVMTGEKPSQYTEDRDIAAVFFNKVMPLWGRDYGGTWFKWNSSAGYYIQSYGKTMPYQPNQWYNVKVHTNLTTRTQTSWINNQVLAENVPIDSTDYPEIFKLAAGNGGTNTKAWFDDVRIGYSGPRAEPSPTPTVTPTPGANIPVVLFTADRVSGISPLTVTFTDKSSGNPVSWKWAYRNRTVGWTQFATTQNPAYTFARGVYDINLTVTNSAGSNNYVNTSYVNVVGVLSGQASPPTDPDNDGLYEDLNGNSALDFNDVQVFFRQMDGITASEPITLFDFNHNGGIDFNDIQLLFRKI